MSALELLDRRFQFGRRRFELAEVAPDRAAEFTDADGSAADRFEKLINVKDRGQIFRVEVDSIEHIEAAGDYMCIYTGDNSLILRETMKDLERRLDPRKFQRVHRSTIVNLDQVRQMTAEWLRTYNEERPHDALGDQTPAAYREAIEAGVSTFEVST